MSVVKFLGQQVQAERAEAEREKVEVRWNWVPWVEQFSGGMIVDIIFVPCMSGCKQFHLSIDALICSVNRVWIWDQHVTNYITITIVLSLKTDFILYIIQVLCKEKTPLVGTPPEKAVMSTPEQSPDPKVQKSVSKSPSASARKPVKPRKSRIAAKFDRPMVPRGSLSHCEISWSFFSLCFTYFYFEWIKIDNKMRRWLLSSLLRLQPVVKNSTICTRHMDYRRLGWKGLW